MTTTTVPMSVLKTRSSRPDGEGSVQVQLDPAVKSGNAKVFAVYGKGGIGKSFSLANLSYMLAQQGKKVLLIGCDPKSDTTALLFGGRSCPTIIETSAKKKLAGEAVGIGDVCFKRDGVFAMELGGPEVGRGCGGRGIIHGFELLEKLGFHDWGFDYVLLDFLGDVVCGGFAAPLQHADRALVVAANDFDSIFAMNRIVAAIQAKSKNYNVRLGGVIANRSAATDQIDKFNAAVGLQTMARFPDLDAIRRSRLKKATLFEMEATPEIEAELKKGAAAKRFAEVAEGLSNMVYEQPTSLKPVNEAFKLPVQQSGWFSRNGGAPPALAHPKVIAEIFSDNAIKAKRNTAAVESVAGTIVAARVIEHKPAEQRPLEAVRAQVEARAKREEALKLATAEGEAALKDYQAGKDPGLKWPAPLAVSRQKPGGLPPPVLDRVFKADAKALPGYAGTQTPAGYAVVKVTKVIDIGEIDEAKRRSLAAQLQQAVALGELESSIGSLRESIGVQLRKDALEKKSSAQ